MSKDTRFVYGAGCTYTGDIHTVGKLGNLPCCPYCRGMLYEMPHRDDWYNAIDEYAKEKNDPEYAAMYRWHEGKQCIRMHNNPNWLIQYREQYRKAQT